MTATAAPPTIRVAIEPGIATVTLDRPPLNVLTTRMLDELERALHELRADRELRLIVLRGAGRAFSAGVDVGEHLGDSLAPLLDAFARVATELIDCEVPTLAVVQGAALGGACEIVALCDLAIAADDAKLGTPEITLGVVPPVGAAVFPALVGAQRANALVLTGAPATGAEAAAWGLVWRSVPKDSLDDVARATAVKLAGLSAASLRLAKRTIRVSARAALGAAVASANDEQLRSIPRIADAQEGLRAFLEKRPPRWMHR